MSQQTQWKTMADKHYLVGVQRAQEQQFYKQKLKQAYMSELSNQMRANEELKRKKQYVEHLTEKQLVDEEVDKQKRLIQAERMRVRMKNQRAERVDAQTEVLQEMKRKQAELGRQFDVQMQMESNRVAERIEAERKNEQARKRQEFRRNQVDLIESNRQYKTLSEKYEKEHDRQRLQEGENRKIRDEIERVRFYNELKERSKLVDYGSHRVFQEKNSKSLVEKKREEWKIYRDSLQLQEKTKETEETSRMQRLMLENQYRQQLQRQIQERSLSHKNKAVFDLQSDKKTIEYSQELSDRAYLSRKEQQEGQKKRLAEYLRYQANQKAKERQAEPEMKVQEMKLNIDLLSQEHGLNSMDTYHLDPQRRKQLQILQSSINPSRYATDPPEMQKMPYFANRGIDLMK